MDHINPMSVEWPFQCNYDNNNHKHKVVYKDLEIETMEATHKQENKESKYQNAASKSLNIKCEGQLLTCECTLSPI